MAEIEKQYKRLYPRRKVSVSCQLIWQDDHAFGNAVDVSLGGLSVVLRRPIHPNGEGVVVQIPEGIVVRARPVHEHSLARGTLVGFEIERIESGKQEWQRLCYVPAW